MSKQSDLNTRIEAYEFLKTLFESLINQDFKLRHIDNIDYDKIRDLIAGLRKIRPHLLKLYNLRDRKTYGDA